MPPVLKVTEHGALIVAEWKLDAGESVPLHTHVGRPGTEHITIVAKGAVEISGDGFEPVTLQVGALYDYKPNEQTHRLVALADGTVIFNIPKGAAL